MNTKTEYEFIEITDNGVTRSGKTHLYIVRSKSGNLLGEVKWWARWRQYAFFPERDTLYSAGCLDDISGFIRSLRVPTVQ